MGDRAYKVNLESFNTTCHPPPAQVNIFTARSKIDEHVGNGFVIYNKNKERTVDSIRLAEEIIVYQAEVLVIKKGAQKFVEIKDRSHTYIKIFSDLQAA